MTATSEMKRRLQLFCVTDCGLPDAFHLVFAFATEEGITQPWLARVQRSGGAAAFAAEMEAADEPFALLCVGDRKSGLVVSTVRNLGLREMQADLVEALRTSGRAGATEEDPTVEGALANTKAAWRWTVPPGETDPVFEPYADGWMERVAL